MAQYFFDVVNNGNLIQDEEGSDLSTLQDARVEAISILPDPTKNLKFDGDHRTFAVNVRDVIGESVFRAELSFNCSWLK